MNRQINLQNPDFSETIRDENWRDLAECRDKNQNIFFEDLSGFAPEVIKEAKQVCGECAVQEMCLVYALETKQELGIWGGTDERERRRLRKNWLAEQRRVN